ncbi:MAG: cytochrome c biogenesis CcdA family protein [Patescibacteria group bacterium]|jgi:cytochrome c biogenesis protein CcdA
MKKILNKKSFFASLGCLVLIVTALFLFMAPSKAQTKPGMILYFGQGCPHCAVVEQYIQDNKLDDTFSIIRKEVYSNSQNAQELTQYFIENNVPSEQQGVPFAVISGHYYVGDGPIISALENPSNQITRPVPTNTNAAQTPTTTEKHLNFLIVTGAALVDAINPCEFAVLIILMATVLAASHRRRALLSGLLFSLAVYISYLAMGLGLFSAIAAVGVTSWIQRVAGGLAVVLGLFNLKDAIWYGKGFLLEVPFSWRPRMKRLLQSVTNPFAALLIGFVVSLFLLPCTSGPYIVIVGMLGKESTFSQALWWLIYYNLIFILPMLTITFAVFFGFKPESLESIRQKRLRLLHAVAGILLLALGIYLVVY